MNMVVFYFFLYLNFEIIYSIFSDIEEKISKTIMEEKRIRRNLYRVLRKTGVEKNNITLKTSYSDDLQFDQVDWSIFAYYLEGIFNISIRDEELNNLGTVQNTIQYLGQTA